MRPEHKVNIFEETGIYNGSGMGGGHISSHRGQAAIEYLITYGWAILIIVAALGMLYFYVGVPMSIQPNTCDFVVGVSCSNYNVAMVSGSKSTANVSLMMENPQYYPIKDPVMTVSISGKNYTAACSPAFVNPGATFVCASNILDNFGSHLKANVYISEYNCGLSKYGEFNGTCADPPMQIYKGLLYDTFNKNITVLPTRIAVVPQTQTLAVGSDEYVNSSFDFVGVPTPSVTLNYTLNNTDARFQNGKGFTGSSEVASDRLYALHSGTVEVTVSYDGYSANAIITIS